MFFKKTEFMDYVREHFTYNQETLAWVGNTIDYLMYQGLDKNTFTQTLIALSDDNFTKQDIQPYLR